MSGEWSITSKAIDGDDESFTPEQIAKINLLAKLAGVPDFDVNDYELGKIQAELLIMELERVVEAKMDSSGQPEAISHSGPSVWKVITTIAGIGFFFSMFGDDCDECE